MGLKRIQKKPPLRRLVFAPCMGLKSFEDGVSDLVKRFAPCMGLKSFIVDP